MINRIKLHDIATYDDVEIFPKKINYLFGGNGTGKTTISNLLNSMPVVDNASIDRDNDSNEIVLVFNRFFIRNNLKPQNGLDGILTLGEETIKYKEEIEKLNENISNYQHQIEKNRATEEHLTTELATLKTEIEEICWKLKQKFGSVFPKAFEGTLNSKNKFAEKIISEFSSYHADHKAILFDELKKEYDTAFSQSSEIKPVLNAFNTGFLSILSNTSLLEESIIGSSHSQVGELISKLNATDWVKGGINFARAANGKCPYCQQPISDSIQKEIEEYFDVSYMNKCAALEKYLERYVDFIDYLRNYRNSIPQNADGINYMNLQDQFDTLITEVERNIIIVEKKVETPSQQCSLKPLDEYISDIQKTISSLNEAINNHNKIVSDTHAKDNCKKKVISMCLSEIYQELKSKLDAHSGKQKGLTKLRETVSQMSEQIAVWQSEISVINSKISSVKPTVDSINLLLSNFGFGGFMLTENKDESGSYKVVRPNGADAIDTLSEGEYNFISFLYFYHLCFGSKNKEDLNRKKIIVIDDPISSLDSNVMFIVSSLTKDILRKCKDNKDNINQVFVLTHNAYFYKEVTYWGSRESLSSTLVAYYVIKKKDNISFVTSYEKSPINSSYELMWEEIKNPKSSKSFICNTMRRILEHYFNVIGGLNYDKCIDEFTGSERLICKSLISFINDSSHSIFDDYTMYVTDESVEAYLNVFEKIFDKMGHSQHYNMMMKLSN